MPELAALEELDFPAEALPVKAELAGHRRPVGRKDEFKEELARRGLARGRGRMVPEHVLGIHPAIIAARPGQARSHAARCVQSAAGGLSPGSASYNGDYQTSISDGTFASVYTVSARDNQRRGGGYWRVPPLTPEAHEVAARLARMKKLLDDLERVCSESEEQRSTVSRLRAEMDAARQALKIPKSG